MIPADKLQILIDFSVRNKDLELELRKDAPEDVIELAKQFYWKPFDKTKDGTFQL